MGRPTKAEKIAASTPINQRALLTRSMAADYLSLSVPTLKSYEDSGDLKGIPIGTGKEKRYRRSDLDDLIDRVAERRTNQDKVKESFRR